MSLNQKHTWMATTLDLVNNSKELEPRNKFEVTILGLILEKMISILEIKLVDKTIISQ